MTDERRGLPSASSFDRLAVCPGSFSAEKNMPDESSEMSKAGDLGHSCLAGEIPIDELDDDTAKTVAVIQSLEPKLLEKFDFSDGKQIREERLWFEIDDEKFYSGKADLVVIKENKAFIIDYKTGPIPVDHAHTNMQLRALVALVHLNHPNLTEIKAAIIQPRNFDAPITVTEYREDDIWAVHYQITNIIAEIEDEDAPRKATENGCRYCKAKPTCPEANQTIMEIQNTKNNLPAIPTPDLLEKCAIAKKVITKIEDNAREALINDPCSIPGYYLKPGSTRKVINNPEGVFYQAAILGIDGSEFASICDVNKTKLKALIKDKTGRKGKELDQAITDILDGNTTEKQNKPSLAKDKSSD